MVPLRLVLQFCRKSPSTRAQEQRIGPPPYSVRDSGQTRLSVVLTALLQPPRLYQVVRLVELERSQASLRSRQESLTARTTSPSFLTWVTTRLHNSTKYPGRPYSFHRPALRLDMEPLREAVYQHRRRLLLPVEVSRQEARGVAFWRPLVRRPSSLAAPQPHALSRRQEL